VGQLRPSLCLPTGTNHPKNSGLDSTISRNDCVVSRISEPCQTMAPSVAPAKCSTQSTSSGCIPVPVHSSAGGACVSPRPQPLRPGIQLASVPLRDSSSRLYDLHWKLFVDWIVSKDIPVDNISFHHLAEYLTHLFHQGKQVNTIKVHRASITSVLKLKCPPSTLQEETLTNLIKSMSIQRPRTQHILPKWRPSVVLNAFMKPPFIINGSDKNISLELFTYKTAFLVALASGARGSELVALSRADHNLHFTQEPSGAKRVSVNVVPNFMPKNAVRCPYMWCVLKNLLINNLRIDCLCTLRPTHKCSPLTSGYGLLKLYRELTNWLLWKVPPGSTPMK